MPILGIWASQISGHLWAPSGAYDALATVTVPSGGLASITFAGIPTGYKHLQIRGITQTNRATYGIDEWKVTFNGVTSSIYSYHNLYGDGANPTAGAGTSTAFINIVPASASSVISNTFGTSIVDLLDYANVSKYKTLRALSGTDINGTTAGYGGYVGLTSGLFQSNDAISSIQVAPKFGSLFNQYSQFALYGVK